MKSKRLASHGFGDEVFHEAVSGRNLIYKRIQLKRIMYLGGNWLKRLEGDFPCHSALTCSINPLNSFIRLYTFQLVNFMPVQIMFCFPLVSCSLHCQDCAAAVVTFVVCLYGLWDANLFLSPWGAIDTLLSAASHFI